MLTATKESIYSTTISRDIQAYVEQGFDAIPLEPMTKKPTSKGWQRRPPFRQWKDAPTNANIGLRAGNGKAFIDADDKNQPGASETVMNWLEGLGIMRGTYPAVRTPNHGTHIYINFAGNIGKHSADLKITAGEFRVGNGAFVVAPPSVIDAGAYQFIGGDIAQLPTLDAKDVARLVDISDQPLTLPGLPRMSSLAYSLAVGEADLIDRYDSRSHAEQALMLSLVNSGFDFEQIQKVFDDFPCAGKYAEKKANNPKEAAGYLWRTYQAAVRYQENESPFRRNLSQLIEQVRAEAWTNANRQAVFLAHLNQAYKVGQGRYAFSARDMSTAARLGLEAANNHTKKLVADGLLSLVKPGTVQSAAVYALQAGQNRTLPKNPTVRKCSVLSIVQHDAFRNGAGLGRRAGQVYALLLESPMTEQELTDATGANIKTIQRALKKLGFVVDRRTGEIITLVERDGGSAAWSAKKVDLDHLAFILGTAGATEKARRRYQEDRRAHDRALQLGLIRKG